MLGLGELTLFGRERIQFGSGRLDLLEPERFAPLRGHAERLLNLPFSLCASVSRCSGAADNLNCAYRLS